MQYEKTPLKLCLSKLLIYIYIDKGRSTDHIKQSFNHSQPDLIHVPACLIKHNIK